MKSRKGMVWLAILLVLALVVFCNRGRIHFDWAVFWQQLRHVSWMHIAAGIALIYATYWLRAARWSVFLSATKKVSPFVLVGPQFIGFTAVCALWTAGRRDPARAGGQAGAALRQLADGRLHHRAHVRPGRCGDDLLRRAAVCAARPAAPRNLRPHRVALARPGPR